jgi:hypothetical protein
MSTRQAVFVRTSHEPALIFEIKYKLQKWSFIPVQAGRILIKASIDITGKDFQDSLAAIIRSKNSIPFPSNLLTRY